MDGLVMTSDDHDPPHPVAHPYLMLVPILRR